MCRDMVSRPFQPDSILSFMFILIVVTERMLSVSCLDSRDARPDCDIIGAHFVAANAIRVRWQSSSPSTLFTTDPVVVKCICQLRLASESCDIPVEEHDAACLHSSMSQHTVNNYTFWVDYAKHHTTKNYTICIRTVIQKDSDDVWNSTWKVRTLQWSARMPPIVKKCSLLIDNKEEHSVHFQKRNIYLYSTGDNISFSCDVDGKPFPRVMWLKDGQSISRNTSVLILHHAEKYSEGIYAAVFANDFGQILSIGMEIRLSGLGQFERDTGAGHLKFKKGDSFNLGCPAPNSVPAPEIRWIQKTKSTLINFDERIVLGVDGSLIILNADVTDSGSYACKVTNRQLDESLESKETFVDITDVATFDIQPVIQNKGPPNEETVLGLVGETVKLQCVFSGRPKPQLLFYKGDSALLPTSGVSDNRLRVIAEEYALVIGHLRKTDEGSYRCQGNNSVGSNHFEIKLIVHEPPKITVGLLSKNVTVGESVGFVCQGFGTPHPSIDWRVNGQLVTADFLKLWNATISSENSQLIFYNVELNHTCNIQCNISNDYGYVVSNAYLSVLAATVIVQESDVATEQGNGFIILDCEAETDTQTPLNISWLRGADAAIKPDEVYVLLRNGSLLINWTASTNRKESFSDNYTCLASNGLSSDTRVTHVEIVAGEEQEPILTALHVAGVSGAILFGIIVVITITTICIIIRQHKCKHRNHHALISSSLSSTRMPQLSHGDSRSVESNECLVCESGWCTALLPLNDRLKATIRQMYIQRDRLQMERIIGKGQFGRVYLALLRDPRGDLTEHVAVKTMKYKPDESEMVELFLKEAVIMKDFQHINVLGIRGITFDADNSPMVILPFMANGDLRNYILNPDLDITILQLLMMGLQVAHGMQYLSHMRFVHRDLAARNCMVNERSIVKVADFGLSRELIVRDYYRVESSGTTPVPVRWMAPECLEANVFSTMSDVWSFGVLLWELMTRGAVPYPDVENWQIPSHVQSGKRLEQPTYCPDIVYEIMKNCWETEQHNRPSFQALVENIQNVIHSAKPGARMSSLLYHNIVHASGSAAEIGKSTRTLDYRQ